MSEKSQARKGSEALRMDDIDVPLLDEVNKVIEKEKTLLALKLLDQEQRSLEWQQKYHDLVDKVADDGGKASTIEFIADSMEMNDQPVISEQLLVQPLSVDREFILKRLLMDQTTLNLSNIALNNHDILQTIAKFLCSWKKDLLAARIRVIIMSHCGLNDDNVELLDIIANPCIQGLDLSHNCLSLAFQRRMFQVYKVWKCVPMLIMQSLTCLNRAFVEPLNICCSMETWSLMV